MPVHLSKEDVMTIRVLAEKAHKNSDLVNIFKGFINPVETACAKIAHQYVEILNMFQDSLKTVQ